MSCQFRFVDRYEPRTVALRLFTDAAGNACGEVLGPLVGALQGQAGVDRCVVDDATALMAAIRIANSNDAEIVVMGDASLWNPRWGTLVRERD